MKRKELLNLSTLELDKTVKVAGTMYDRRRKVSPDMARKMQQMINAGKSYNEVAKHFNVSDYTVRIYAKPGFKKAEKKRLAQYIHESNYDYDVIVERSEYKRNLIKQGKKIIINA